MANKESTFGNAISLRQYLNEQLSSDGGYSNFMRITNINNANAVPTDMAVGTTIQDAQLVWVGDQFYLQGKKVYPVGTTIDSRVTTEEEYSQTYLFPFNAIAVKFVELPNNNTLCLELNLPEGVSASGIETYKTGLKQNDNYTLPTIEGYTATWKIKGTNTTATSPYSFPNNITGVVLSAEWTSIS